MNPALATTLSNYNSDLVTTLQARETWLHANKFVGQLNADYTAGIDALAQALIDWYEYEYRPAVVNEYLNTLGGYLVQHSVYPDAVPVLGDDSDYTPYALLNPGNDILQFLAAAHVAYRDPDGQQGGGLLTALAEDITTEQETEITRLRELQRELTARTAGLVTMQGFITLTVTPFEQSDITEYVFDTLGWTDFIKSTGLHITYGVFAYPPDEDYAVVAIPQLPEDGDDEPGQAPSYQDIEVGDVPLYVRGAQASTIFQVNVTDNSIAWSSGTVYYVDDVNQAEVANFNSGTAEYTGDIIYVAWTPLDEDLIVTTNRLTAYQPDQIVLASYAGGNALYVYNATRKVDGEDINDGTLRPEALKSGNIEAEEIFIGDDSDGQAIRISGTESSLSLFNNDDELTEVVFIGKYEDETDGTRAGFRFSSRLDGSLLLSDEGLGDDVVDARNIRRGAIREQHLYLAQRSVYTEDFIFSVVHPVISWTTGLVNWVDDLGNDRTTQIWSGEATYTGQYLYIIWVEEAETFTSTVDPDVAYADNTLIVGTYNGTQLMQNFTGNTVIDGNRIITGSIHLDRLMSEEILTQILYLGSEEFVLDGSGTNRKIDIYDTQGTPELRVRIGKLGNLSTDWGIQIYKANGDPVIDLDGTWDLTALQTDNVGTRTSTQVNDDIDAVTATADGAAAAIISEASVRASADSALASRATTLEATVPILGASRNLVQNSTFQLGTTGLDGWSIVTGGSGVSKTLTRQGSGQSYYGRISWPSAASGIIAALVGYGEGPTAYSIVCMPNTRYAVGVRHRGKSGNGDKINPVVHAYQASGANSSTYSPTMTAFSGYSLADADGELTWYHFTTPSDASFFYLELEAYKTSGGDTGSGTIDFDHPIVVQVPDTQTIPPPWTSGEATNLSARVTTTEVAFADLEGSVYAQWGVTLDVNGRISSLTAFNDGDTSSFVFNADVFQIYNGTSDEAIFEVVGSTIRIRAEHIQIMSSGAAMELVNSTDTWQVALQSRDFNVTDGDTIDFEADLGQVPTVTFNPLGLDALGSGETYNLYTEDLTTTGCTVRLRIVTPGSTTLHVQSGSSTTYGSGPTIQFDKTVADDAYNGYYSIAVDATIPQTSSYPTGGTRQKFYEGYVEFFADDGGGWVSMGTFKLSTTLNSAGFGPYDQTVAQQFSVYWPNPIGQHGGREIGGSAYSVGTTINEIISLVFTYNTPSTDRTACPNDETCVANVRPRN